MESLERILIDFRDFVLTSILMDCRRFETLKSLSAPIFRASGPLEASEDVVTFDQTVEIPESILLTSVWVTGMSQVAL